MRDSVQIENLAAAHIIELFSSCKRITPWIKTGDREPLWDGFLYLYDSEEHNVTTTRGRVSCQVKGKELATSPETETFYLTYEELENYLRDGGILFFVVHIDNPEKPSFWAKLTPVELRTLLKELKDSQNKGKTVTLNRMPDKLSLCEAETFDFYQHCQLQKAPPIDMAKVSHSGNHFRVVGIRQNGTHPIVALTKGFHYLYNCDENDSVLNVVGDTQYSFEISKEVDDGITVGGKSFAVPVRLVAAKGAARLMVGDFMSIDIIAEAGADRKFFSR